MRSIVKNTLVSVSGVLLATAIFAVSAAAQTNGPVVVRPGAPGEATKVLPADTRSSLPPLSQEDVVFMQGMIMHHAQAVEMTAMINDRTDNEKLRLLGSRISQSQSSEMNFMKRWLTVRVQFSEMKMAGMGFMFGHSGNHMDHGKMDHSMMMPGMLTAEQMKALDAAKGDEFDRLFLEGMIQHHTGALIMVKELFDSAGAGQDAEIFNFATDVDSGQRAEIRIMQTMLGIEPQ